MSSHPDPDGGLSWGVPESTGVPGSTGVPQLPDGSWVEVDPWGEPAPWGGPESWGGPDSWCPLWEEASARWGVLSDAQVIAGLVGPAHPCDVAVLASIDAGALCDPGDRIGFLRAVDRVVGFVAALRADAVVAFAGPASVGAYLPEVHLEQELSVAARVSRYSAGKQIEIARALATTFPGFKAALRAGEITGAHCTILVEGTRLITDPVALAALAKVALPKASRMTPGQFAKEITALVARFDPDASGRARRAIAERRVSVRELGDGMGFLGLVHDWATINAIGECVRADGRRLHQTRRTTTNAQVAPDAHTATVGTAAVTTATAGIATTAAATGMVNQVQGESEGVGEATADACRADALAARILGVVTESGEIIWEREAVQVQVQVVIDLATLRGEVQNPCLLDGMAVPAQVGREIAGYANAFRRMVTDPVTGHLLDYGHLVYLPQPLRTYVLARDGGCTTPGCTTRAPSRLQLDHATAFPAGPSNTTNTHGRCTTCHQLKTAGYAQIQDTHPDGSHTWQSHWGQRVHIGPRPYLPGHHTTLGDQPPQPQPPEQPPDQPNEPPPPEQPPDPPPF